jgi:hypothetical protein
VTYANLDARGFGDIWIMTRGEVGVWQRMLPWGEAELFGELDAEHSRAFYQPNPCSKHPWDRINPHLVNQNFEIL